MWESNWEKRGGQAKVAEELIAFHKRAAGQKPEWNRRKAGLQGLLNMDSRLKMAKGWINKLLVHMKLSYSCIQRQLILLKKENIEWKWKLKWPASQKDKLSILMPRLDHFTILFYVVIF